MQIDNEFTVGVPIDRAWEVLTDLEGIAPCLPGAQLTGVNDGVYTGKVKIKVGPVISEYAGTAKFTEKDDAAHRAVIDAKGKDSRGAGTASASIRAQLRADGDQTIVSVNTDLSITGQVAQFGSGMIKEISAKLLGQFAQNLEAKLLAPQPADTTAASAPADTTTASAAPAPCRQQSGTRPVPAPGHRRRDRRGPAGPDGGGRKLPRQESGPAGGRGARPPRRHHLRRSPCIRPRCYAGLTTRRSPPPWQPGCGRAESRRASRRPEISSGPSGGAS